MFGGLPAVDVDRHRRRNLARITDENVSISHVAHGQEIGPRHLPGLVDEEDVEVAVELRQGQLRHRGDHDDRSVGNGVLLVDEDHSLVDVRWPLVAGAGEPHDRSLRVTIGDALTDFVDLVVGLGRDDDAPVGLHAGLQRFDQRERLARTWRSLDDRDGTRTRDEGAQCLDDGTHSSPPSIGSTISVAME